MTQKPVLQELYDSFYRKYWSAPRETLLELVRGDLDIERMRQLSQPELAESCCEKLVYSAVGPDRIL